MLSRKNAIAVFTIETIILGSFNSQLVEVSNGRGSGQAKGTGTRRILAKIGHSTYIVDELTGNRFLLSPLKSAKDINDPTHRDDVFLQGSMNRIPAFERNVARGTLTTQEWSVIVANRVPSRDNIQKRDNCRCRMARFLRKMLNMSLLLSPTFLIYAVSVFFAMLGFFTPLIFMQGIIEQHNLPKTDAELVVTIFGVTNAVGRLLCGLISDNPRVNVRVLHFGALLIAGTTTIFVPFFHELYALYILYAVVNGVAIAFYVSLMAIVLLELMGLDNLTNAYGVASLYQGAGIMLGPPIAGWLKDSSGAYNQSYYFAGAIMFLSGLVMIPAGWVKRWESGRNKKDQEIKKKDSKSKKHSSFSKSSS